MAKVLKTLFKERFKVSEERLEHCRVCDKFEHGPNRCKECGCFMDYKTLLPWESCPLMKWGAYKHTDPDDFREIPDEEDLTS